jgi:hypothetical protein
MKHAPIAFEFSGVIGKEFDAQQGVGDDLLAALYDHLPQLLLPPKSSFYCRIKKIEWILSLTMK